jgi:signal transduction histidine kinase
MERAYTARWLRPLGLQRVRIVSLPDAGDPRAPADDAARLEVLDPDGRPDFAVQVTPLGLEAVRDRLLEEEGTRVGLALLAGWAALVVAAALLVGRVRAPRARRLVVGAVALLARSALDVVDLPGRFPGLRAAFSPSDFGVEDPLGWLASPADFALTALAFLVAAGCFAAARPRAFGEGPRWGRALALAGGPLIAAACSALWIAVVDLAVAQGQTAFFQAASFIPPVPAALMLTGLAAATAAAWLVAAAALHVAASSWGAGSRVPWRLLLGLLGAALAFAVVPEGPSRWASLLIPLAAALPAFPREDAASPASAGRILVLSVLVTAMLFPLLWGTVGERRAQRLADALDDLMAREAMVRNDVEIDLAAAAEDEWLREGLKRARDGTPPEALAFHLWVQSAMARPGENGRVTVLDAERRLLGEFGLAVLPPERIPRPQPPAEGDLQVVVARGDAVAVRSVIGRLRVRDGDQTLGYVVVTVPDLVELAVLGLDAGRLGPARRTDDVGPGREGVEVAVLEGGRVIASSDPSVSRQPGGFGPEALAGLTEKDPALAWRTEAEEGRATFSAERGAVIALKRPTADFGDVLLALARLVIVGVGLGALAAVGGFLLALRSFRWRLHHKILLSYFLISIIPLVLLGVASAREARARHDQRMTERLATDIGRARTDLEALGAQLFDRASDHDLSRWAAQRRHDLLLYRDGLVSSSSRAGLVTAELLPSRLPAEAYRATVLDRRETVRREAFLAGDRVWFGYAPVLDEAGRTRATVSVPLLYDQDRVEEELTVTGSVILAAYLLTVVLVLVGGIYAARNLARPLDLLSAGTRRVAEGDLDVEIPGEGGDELGQLVGAFNAMTRALRELTERAVKAERETAWRRMARQVAHEIKNPLTPMRLMIQQLEADVAREPDRAPEAIRRTTAVVLRQIEALGRIAGDFANFARLPQRKPRDVDAAALILEVVDLYGGSKADGIDVAAQVEPGLPRVHGDEAEIRRVLLNLVGNAVQAIEGRGRVTLRARSADGPSGPGVAVEVEDTGVGIPSEHVARLFEPDFSTKTSGTGLGLAIVRRILEDMGGTIEVESAPGRGSTFRMWWPCRAP